MVSIREAAESCVHLAQLAFESGDRTKAEKLFKKADTYCEMANAKDNPVILRIRKRIRFHTTLVKSSWFFGYMDHTEAERILLMPENEDDGYLIREVEDLEAMFCLCVRLGDTIEQYFIQCFDDGDFFIINGHKFHSLQSLVNHYCKDARELCVKPEKVCIKIDQSSTSGVPPEMESSQGEAEESSQGDIVFNTLENSILTLGIGIDDNKNKYFQMLEIFNKYKKTRKVGRDVQASTTSSQSSVAVEDTRNIITDSRNGTRESTTVSNSLSQPGRLAGGSGHVGSVDIENGGSNDVDSNTVKLPVPQTPSQKNKEKAISKALQPPTNTTEKSLFENKSPIESTTSSNSLSQPGTLAGGGSGDVGSVDKEIGGSGLRADDEENNFNNVQIQQTSTTENNMEENMETRKTVERKESKSVPVSASVTGQKSKIQESVSEAFTHKTKKQVEIDPTKMKTFPPGSSAEHYPLVVKLENRMKIMNDVFKDCYRQIEKLKTLMEPVQSNECPLASTSAPPSDIREGSEEENNLEEILELKCEGQQDGNCSGETWDFPGNNSEADDEDQDNLPSSSNKLRLNLDPITKTHPPPKKMKLAKQSKIHNACPKCDECGKILSSLKSLNEHIILVHQRKHNFKCSFCDFGCQSQSSLDVHKLIHSDMRRFKCKFCNKGFKQRNVLTKHMKIHSTKGKEELRMNRKACPSEKPKTCKECGKTLSSAQRWREHVSQVHRKDHKFKCTVCDFGCQSQYILDTHLLTHTKVRSFKCTLCEKSFKHKNSLTFHLNSHTREERMDSDESSTHHRRLSRKRNHLRQKNTYLEINRRGSLRVKQRSKFHNHKNVSLVEPSSDSVESTTSCSSNEEKDE